MLNRLPIVLAQLQAENNSNKLKNEIGNYCILFIVQKIWLNKSIKVGWYYLKRMETIFMNTENSKTNEPHRFRLDLADKLNLKNPKKNIALVNLSIY